jgi:quinohemoprotein ethanol dehydrogenase
MVLRGRKRLVDTATGAVVAVLVLGLAAVATGATTTAQRSPQAIVPAPAFSTDELATLPTDNWITNGGSLSNQRYSPLDLIDTSNVKSLKGVWMTHLKSGLAAKYSAEGQPLEYQGIIYIPTGQDDVFAIDADTGKILWKYTGNLDQKISTICCGWDNRGVGLGDGKVYVGRLDGKLVALDQKTGKEVWSTLVMPWQQGYSITSAPLYVDGMVITGISGGEYGIRGRVTAYDAQTGKERWRFYTIPGPGEPGHETWPATGNAWEHGSAPVWQTPSVDPKLGLLYFSTGNAGPDNDGSHRAGMNLYSASMLALDLKTGKLRWHFQMVHHDIWDYDATSPTVLFDATIGGKNVQGIGEASKTGWLYLLDRATGEPLFPMPEKPVPQNADQKTWPTQPTPSYEPFIPHAISQQQYAEIVKLAQAATVGKQATAKTVKVIKATEMYTPFWKTLVALTPGPQGGTNWQPSSYNPGTHMFYVCAQSGPSGYAAETQPPKKQTNPVQYTVGSALTIGGGFGKNLGTFTAIDATTGKIAWQKRWTDSCYAGSTTTAGNLVFIGRNDGRLLAYDARNGNELWSFQTGAGANDAPTIFRRNGKEYVAFYAGGNALGATPHGDNVWLFSLDGKLGPAAAPGGGKGVSHAGAVNTPSPNAPGSAAAGRSIYAQNCASCHGPTGHGGNGGPDLTSISTATSFQTVMRQVFNGGGGMPAFKGTLNPKQIRDVATYVVQNITHGKLPKK